MTILSVRSKNKNLSLHSLVNHSGLYSILALATILLASVIVPEISNPSFAEETAPEGMSVIGLTLSPVNTMEEGKYVVSFTRRRDSTLQFGTIGIKATVNTSSVGEHGYTLTMHSSDYLGRLVHNDSDLRETNYIAPLEAPVTITDKDNASGNDFLGKSVNHYGYSTDWNNTNSTGTFNPIPSEETVIERYKTQEASVMENIITIGIGINENLMFGNYKGDLVFTAYSNSSHNVVDHFILGIEPGDASTPSGIPVVQQNDKNDPAKNPFLQLGDVAATQTSKTFDLSSIFNATLPSLEGHTFKGFNEVPAFYGNGEYYEWDETKGQYIVQDHIGEGTAEERLDTPTYYYNGATWVNKDVSISTSDETTEAVAYTSHTKKLYIVWEQPSWDASFMAANVAAQQVARGNSATEFDSYFKMQDMTASICSNVTTIDTQTTLIDTRDAKTYTVIKAQDDNCWMTQNLALGTTTAKTWYFNTTNMDPSSTSNYSVAVPASVGLTSVAAQGTAGEDGYIPAYSYPTWTTQYSTRDSNNMFAYDEYIDKNNSSKTNYGNYYTYHLALGLKSNTGTKAADYADESVPYSICSKGWKMPTISEYTTLTNSTLTNTTHYTHEQIIGSPLNFVLGGKVFRTNEIKNGASYGHTNTIFQNTYGFYWTRSNAGSLSDTKQDTNAETGTETSTYAAKVLIINADGTPETTDAYLHRGNGASIRCLADANNNYILYLDANGGVIPAATMTASTNAASYNFPLSTNSSYIPYRDSYSKTEVDGNVTEYYRYSYTFLGWHTAPTFTDSEWTTINESVGEDKTYSSIKAAVLAEIAYPYDNGTFTNGTVEVTASNGYSKVLYAMWAENVILERVDSPTIEDVPADREPGVEKTDVKNEDNSSKDYANPYGEDTIDDSIPSAVLEVVKLIRKLPDPSLVSLDHGDQITEVRDAYESLSNSEKAMIGTDLTNKYNSVLAAYYSLLAAENTGSNIFIAALVGAAVSIVAFTVFIIIKKEKEEEEEEEE